MKTNLKTIALLAVASLGTVTARAVETVGDIATNFTIVNHANGEPLSLHDYEGSVILIDFFAYWCPYCRAQSPQIEDSINGYYHSREGNPYGVPVTVITVSFDCSNQSRTDQLINQFGLEIVADDCSAVAYRLFVENGQPHYVVINGLANAAGMQQWEILHSSSGYGGTTAPIATLRSVINTVQPEPPPVVSNPRLDSEKRIVFDAPSPATGTNVVQTSPDMSNWSTWIELSGAGADVEVVGPSIEAADALFIRVIRK